MTFPPHMMLFGRRFVACLLLAALVLTGRFAPCTCVTEAPMSACQDHDHRNPTNPSEHERDCSCPTCHVTVCSHLAFKVEHASQNYENIPGKELVGDFYRVRSWSDPVAEIFTPPKVS